MSTTHKVTLRHVNEKVFVLDETTKERHYGVLKTIYRMDDRNVKVAIVHDAIGFKLNQRLFREVEYCHEVVNYFYGVVSELQFQFGSNPEFQLAVVDVDKICRCPTCVYRKNFDMALFAIYVVYIIANGKSLSNSN